tara:strand:- start:3756 stop:4529 length:774 start_codon:yes stop_codon:yes gene_type:complete
MAKKKKPLTFMPVKGDSKEKSTTKTQKDNKPRLVKVRVNELSGSRLNPTIRTTKQSLKSLKTNLVTKGQLEPITIEARNNGIMKIINGHRRTACFKQLGWEFIDAIILENNHSDYDETFTALHSSSLKITTVQECERWLKGAKSISSNARGKILQLQGQLGKTVARSVISRCVEINKSPGTIGAAIRMYADYINETLTHKECGVVAYWILNVGSSWKMSIAIQAMIPINYLKYLINNKLEIPVDWAHNAGDSTQWEN